MNQQLIIQNLLNKIEDFKNSSFRNIHIKEFPIKIYIRKSYRFHNKKAYSCIDIASVEIEPIEWNKGYFTLFIKELLKKYSNENIFVECIMNPAVITVLNKFKFEKYKDDDCMILIQEDI